MKLGKRGVLILLCSTIALLLGAQGHVAAEVAGDVNRDGKRGLEDAVIILQELSGKEHIIDYDKDGFDTSTDCDDDDPNTYPGAMEICDGVDNDCNDIADEGAQWTNKNQQCLVGVGACQASGIYICDAADPTGPTVCSAAPGAGSTEICDGIDNNCDGQVDEGASWADQGQPCTAGSGACVSSGIRVCNPADPSGPVICSATPGLGSMEVCDGVDNDCDGEIDEGITAPLCPMQDGICTGARQACGGAQGWLPCDYQGWNPNYEPQEQSCDGLDNDCDGAIDFGLVAASCPKQAGVCAGSSELCGGSLGWLACDDITYQANHSGYEPQEWSCDGIDNDCDGDTDEGLVAPPCDLQAGACAGAKKSCGGASGWLPCDQATYIAHSSFYQISETVDGLDNNCDGVVDEGWLNAGKYDQDTACGNYLTDCTAIYARPNAEGRCDSTGLPTCTMICQAGYTDLNQIPTDGCEFGIDTQAIYVSEQHPNSSNLAGCGSYDAPCATIGVGITRASDGTKERVLVASGAYTEMVTLVGGIDLLGGYHPATWERNTATYPTVIHGDSLNGHKKAIIASNINSPTSFDGFVVYGEIAVGNSENSYAFYIEDSDANLSIINNVISAGNGAPGDGGADGTTGSDGGDGSPGADGIETNTSFCQNITPPNSGIPGDGGVNICEGGDASGGDGASAQCPNQFNSQPWGQDGQVIAGGGAGGAGGQGGNDWQSNAGCGTVGTGGNPNEGMPGQSGQDGDDGASGVPGRQDSWSLSGLDFVSASGTDGVHGTPGGGGGGGAGGGFDDNDGCGWGDSLGGSGGGGGGGGCQGTGGAGAFGLYVVYSSASSSLPIIRDNVIHLGRGGNGGDGGNGGVRGAGGSGAPGGVPTGAMAYARGPGGSGGDGGAGGHGGGGGGGAGGSSYGIIVIGPSGSPESSAYATENEFINVTPAMGGRGGSGGMSFGNSAADGEDGQVADVGSMIFP